MEENEIQVSPPSSTCSIDNYELENCQEGEYDYNLKYEDEDDDEENEEDDESDEYNEENNQQQQQELKQVEESQQQLKELNKIEENSQIQLNQINTNVFSQTILNPNNDQKPFDNISKNNQQTRKNSSFKIRTFKNNNSIFTFQINKQQTQQQIIPKSIKQDTLKNAKRESFQILQGSRENRICIKQVNKFKQKPPQITAKSWIVINAKNKQVIGGYQEQNTREIASLTKMMTLYLSIQYMRQMNIIPEKTYFKVSQHASTIKGTSAELEKGDLVSIYDLLHGLMLPSGNDAAIVLAENFGVYIFLQSEEFKEKYGNKQINKKKIKVKNPIMYFIREMNRQAQKFNMFDTYFTNPHGLIHKKNRSSAYDAGQLSLQMIFDPLIREIVSKQVHQAEIYDSQQELKRKIIWKNTNLLLKKGFSGLKTGITNNAGPCLASWFKNNQYSLIVVLLNCKSIKDRWKETIEIVEWASKCLKENEQNK